MSQETVPTARPRPVARMRRVEAYAVPRASAPIDVYLDGNEGPVPPEALLGALQGQSIDVLRRYPDDRRLHAQLAGRFGVTAERLLVTAGADDGLDRICRAFLEPGREVIFPRPGFHTMGDLLDQTGARVHRPDWSGAAFPVDDVLALVNEHTSLIVVTSPNNPTGGVATAAELRRVAEAAPGALVVADLVYADFADEDLTVPGLELENVVVVRSLSKSWGLAGLRVGFLMGAPDVVRVLGGVGAPFAVPGPSLALAEAALATMSSEVERACAVVRRRRDRLFTLLDELGARPLPSQANFVLATSVGAPLEFRDAMARLGIGVRVFPGRAELASHARIACPGSDEVFDRLERALREVLAPSRGGQETTR